MLSPVKHISPLVRFTVRRMLSVDGTVLVRVGQEVSPSDVIAEAILNPKYHLINAAIALNIKNKDLKKHLKRKTGETISKGGILAQKEGFVTREIRAPENCRLVAISNGQLLLELESEPTQVLSGVRGVVKKIEPNLGAEIEATGAWIEGVWGNKKTNFGILNIAMDMIQQEFTTESIDISVRGGILFAGYCKDAKVIKFATEIGIRGLILGSMSSHLIPMVESLPYPVIVLNGFGKITMDSMLFNLIESHKGREICLVGDKQNRVTGEVPFITIPLPSSLEPEEPIFITRLTKGSRVRVTNCIHQGKTGVIMEFSEQIQNYPSGIKMKSVVIDFGENEYVILPIANLEIIE